MKHDKESNIVVRVNDSCAKSWYYYNKTSDFVRGAIDKQNVEDENDCAKKCEHLMLTWTII